MSARLTASRTLFAAGAALALLVGGTASLSATQDKSDQALRDRIERRLQTDVGLGKYDLRVKVDDGDVKLEGTVASESLKSEAARVARMAGIDDVDNDIDVDKDVDQVLANRASRGLRRDGEPVTDSWITNKVQWILIGEPSLDGSKIDVDTDARVVKLEGKVRSSEGRARAVELANKVDGVTKVVDDLDIDKD